MYFSPHAYLTVLVPSFLALIGTVLAARFIAAYFFKAGIVGEDKNKPKPVRLPGSGGIAVAFGLIVGILAYTFGGSFLFVPILSVEPLLATALSIMLITFVGFLDDLNVREKKVKSTDMMDIREGLKQWQKPLLTVIGAFPLMAINAGISTVVLPFIGTVDLGLVYPIIIIPIAVVFASNAFNLLGGFDGLQPGMGIVAALGLLIYSIYFGNGTGILLSAVLSTALIAFLYFNKYPARILPGDSFTYCVGAVLVAIMIMGNAEMFGIIVFLPWIIEFFLHLKRKFKVTDLGVLQKDGTLKAPYDGKIYSLTHVVMNLKKATEKEVTNYLVLLEVLFVILAFGLKFLGIF
jgi:UDP-N-acetylglucosamine--dolichyl-phosphate N-acetylglucosaminephosphotransferase